MEGQLDLGMIRRCRKTLYSWKITSQLRRQGAKYRLVFSSPTAKGLRFARHMFETGVAIHVLPDDGRLDKAYADGIRDAEPPLEHMEGSWLLPIEIVHETPTDSGDMCMPDGLVRVRKRAFPALAKYMRNRIRRVQINEDLNSPSPEET
jgi:hypothetical protein